MSFYSNVVDWDDSAGKEAFEKAKSRFYAEINGLPCQISLPGPDLFIDEVNWNAEIDPQLVLELEKDLVPREVDQTAQRSGVLSLGWDRPIPCSGWEDAEGGGATALAGGNGGAVRGWESSEERGGGGAAGGWDHQKNSNWDGYNSGWGAAKAQESWWLQDSVRNDLPGHYSELKSEPKMREGDGQYYLSSTTFHHRRDDPHQPAKAHRRSSRRWKAPPSDHLLLQYIWALSENKPTGDCSSRRCRHDPLLVEHLPSLWIIPRTWQELWKMSGK
ncbi:unnamed protein product [Spirodela intermedia]|uniref:Uncharacterized protein n=1 Tax=Spirodela intermedia TaxID=51605 RepID=A0A7I8JFL0_SPIIN|nr:unnamed protein product [Spirodela intermedia]CAA6668946.1 unnamed protein product [Spirodela intermedia]